MIIDTNMRATTQRLSGLRQSGVDTIIRYYCRHTRQPEKRLTPDEADAIIRAGMKLAIVYQGAGDSAGSFSQDAGAQDGAYARDYAAQIGQPAGSAIYFAVDYDASESDIRTRIIPHFSAVRQAMSGGTGAPLYQVGVYGSGAVCQALLRAGLVSLTWVSQSGGFSGTAAFLRSGQWNLHQRLPSTLCGMSVDQNDVNPQMPQFGAFSDLTTGASGATVRPAITGPLASLPSISTTFVQEQLQRLNYAPGPIDGVYGPLTRAALLGFQGDAHLPLTGVADAATAAAFETARARPLDPARVRATPDDLRQMGSQTVKQADYTKMAGWISSILGGLGIGNSAIVQMANSAAAPVQPTPIAQVQPQGLFKFLNDLQTFLSSGQPADKLKPLQDSLHQLQTLDLKSLITPDNANLLQQLKGLIPADVLTKNPDLGKVLQTADTVRQVRPQLQTVFDLLPSFFSDGTTLQLLAKGVSTVASSMVPGFGGGLVALGIGLAANYFGNRIIQARVQDHQDGANTRR